MQPRRLLVSLASKAGTDDYGNSYPVGVEVGSSLDGAQVALIPQAGGTGKAAELQFPVPAMALSNTPNIAGGQATPAVANLLQSGPALAAPGFTDWVQTVQFSGDGTGTDARMEFRYIDTSGAAHVIASYDGTGWMFNGPVTFNDGATITGGLTVDTVNGSSSTGAGDNGGVTSGPSGTVSAFPAAGPNHTHAELHHHPI